MNDMDFKPNSHKFKEGQQDTVPEKREVRTVVKNPAKTKKNEIRKLTDVFISEDASNVKSYIWMDVLVPTIKKAIVDIVTDGVNMIFFGEKSRNSRSIGSSKISYRNYYDQKNDQRYGEPAKQRSRFDYDDVTFESRREAEDAIEEMQHVISRYGAVTVADLYDMAMLYPPYTSNKYGWYSVSNATVVRAGNRYVIKLPPAEPVN